jgi:hypothetical protein
MATMDSFSIETETTVLLTMSDGAKIRANVARLADFLTPSDVHRVKQGIERRQRFIDHNLPFWARGIAIAVVALAIGTGSILAYAVLSAPRRPVPAAASISPAAHGQALGSHAVPVAPPPGTSVTTSAPPPGTNQGVPPQTVTGPVTKVAVPILAPVVAPITNPVIDSAHQLTAPVPPVQNAVDKILAPFKL